MGGCSEDPTFVANDVVTFGFTGPQGTDLYSLTVAGGEPSRLTDGSFWEWRSQPGRRPGEIVYLGTNPSELMESYIATFDLSTRQETSRIRALASGVGTFGDDVYYADINGVELHRSHGNEDTIVRTYDQRATISTFAIDPTTQRIAYVSARGGPICHHVLGASDKPVCSKLTARAHTPAFVDAGRAIYAGNSSGIHRIDVASGEETLALETDASGGIAISPDQKMIVYSSCRPTTKIVDLSTSPEKVIVDNTTALSPALSSAGHLVWVQTVDGVRVLMLRTADGRERQLTRSDLGGVSTPSIDPTANNVAFQVKGDKPGIYVASLDPIKTVVTRYTTDANDRAPNWFSSTGVAFEKTHADGSSTTHIIDTGTGAVSEVVDPNVFMTSNPATGEILMLTQSKSQKYIWLDPLSGKQRPGPRGGPQAVTWAWVSPNGKWMSAKAGAGGGVWRARLPDGDLELVHQEKERTLSDSAIDDQGHIIATPAESKGELFVTTVKSGAL